MRQIVPEPAIPEDETSRSPTFNNEPGERRNDQNVSVDDERSHWRNALRSVDGLRGASPRRHGGAAHSK